MSSNTRNRQGQRNKTTNAPPVLARYTPLWQQPISGLKMLPPLLVDVPAAVIGVDRSLNVVFSSLDPSLKATRQVPLADLQLDINEEALNSALGGQEAEFSSTYRTADRDRHFMESIYRPWVGAGQDGGVIIYIVDVTERENAARSSRESEERFRRLIRVIPYGISRTDLTGRLRMSNPAHDQMLGYGPGEIEGHSVWQMFEPSQQAQQRELFFKAIRERPEPFPNRGRCMRKDGSLVDVRFHWAYEIDESGELTGFISILTDITDEIRAERELQEAKFAAERASEEKSRFLAAASHDLQQPLHSLSLMVGVLREAPDDEARLEIFDQMERAVDGAQTLLRAVLDISKLEAGVVKPRLGEIELGDLFAQLESEFSAVAASGDVELRVAPTNLSVISDSVLLKSILHNLVSNALRYTKKGGVLLSARKRGDKVLLQVWDTGIGIPEEKQKEIFEEFTRLHPEQQEAGKVHALGLGLSIVDRACALLGHKISVLSRLGKGSVFTVEAPLVTGDKRRTQKKIVRMAPRELEALAKRSVLVVEDDAVVAEQMTALLAAWGLSSIAVHSSAAALREAHKAGNRFDMICADYNLGEGLNGLEVVERVRAIQGRRIPVILITTEDALTLQTDLDKLGVMLLAKPVKPARLRALVDYLLGKP